MRNWRQVAETVRGSHLVSAKNIGTSLAHGTPICGPFGTFLATNDFAFPVKANSQQKGTKKPPQRATRHLRTCAFVFEAVFEDLGVKRNTFKVLHDAFSSANLGSDTALPIFCSNTSSLSLRGLLWSARYAFWIHFARDVAEN